LVSNRRGRLFETRAELRDDTGALVASATGKYLPIKSADVTEMMADLVGHW
jgi:hypothetical protein